MKKLIFLLATPLLIVACNNSKTGDTSIKDEGAPAVSKQERNKKVVMACIDNFNKGDVDASLKDASAQFIDYGDGSMIPINNLDSLKSMFRMIMSTIEGYHAENPQYFADGDYVLVKADWKGTFKKDMMGIKATGKPISMKDVDIFKLNDDGKIVEHNSIQNFGASLMAQK